MIDAEEQLAERVADLLYVAEGEVALVELTVGHTLVDERFPLDADALTLMPGVGDAVSRIALPMAVWANTRRPGEAWNGSTSVVSSLHTAVLAAEALAIRTVWLSGDAYRSQDDTVCDATPTYTVATLSDVPALIEKLT